MRRFGKIVVLVIVIGAIASYIYIKSTSADVGEIVPEIEGTLENGAPIKISDLRGEYVVLNFWGSWCAPCRLESNDLVDMERTYGEKMVLVTIALEKNAQRGRDYSTSMGYSWKHQIIEETSLLFLSKSARDYGVSSIPAIFLISPTGELLKPNTLAEVNFFLSNL